MGEHTPSNTCVFYEVCVCSTGQQIAKYMMCSMLQLCRRCCHQYSCLCFFCCCSSCRLSAAGWQQCELLTAQQLAAKYGVEAAQPILLWHSSVKGGCRRYPAGVACGYRTYRTYKLILCDSIGVCCRDTMRDTSLLPGSLVFFEGTQLLHGIPVIS